MGKKTEYTCCDCNNRFYVTSGRDSAGGQYVYCKNCGLYKYAKNENELKVILAGKCVYCNDGNFQTDYLEEEIICPECASHRIRAGMFMLFD